MSTVTTEIDAQIAVLRVANPPHGYLNDTITHALDRAVREIEANASAKVIVITGALPGVFIQHYDLRELEQTCRKLIERGWTTDGTRHIPERPVDLLFRRLESSRLPVIAAINGNTMGGGLELALACDFRVAQRGAYLLGLPEIRIGMLPGAGGTQRLTRLIGPGRALDLMLHGRRLSPDQALTYGLVHELDDDALENALVRARDLAKLPAKALAHVKSLVRQTADGPLYQALDRERALFLDLLSSPESVDMMAALNARGGDFRSL
ncbi:MAG: enoyl-CoA hydratase/isomerase family protein [Rhodocyclaceae bacterium]|nr:enoyl-CoA hydratase/isomerase family protein [Rhodocyclaceae bacterium]